MKNTYKYLLLLFTFCTFIICTQACSDEQTTDDDQTEITDEPGNSEEPDDPQDPDEPGNPAPAELTITGFAPAEGYADTQITITGFNFGQSKNSIRIYFNDTRVTEIISLTNTEIIVKAPDEATSGPIRIETGNEITLSGESFIYLQGAQIAALVPWEAWPGETITILGEDFFDIGTDQIEVDFNGTSATILSASSTELKVIVPETAKSGPVTVTFGEIQKIKGPNFQAYALYKNDFNTGTGTNYAPFSPSWSWSPNYIEIKNQYLEFYYNQEALDNDNRRERRGCEVVCDFSTYNEGWYGFSIYLPEGKFPKNSDTHIAQIFQGAGCNSWVGQLSIKEEGLQVRRRWACVESGTAITEDKFLETIPWDTWIPIVVHFKVSLTDAGMFRVWVGDDVASGTPTYNAENIRFAFGDIWLDDDQLGEGSQLGGKFGMYCSGGGDRTIRFDDMAILQGNPENAFELVTPGN